MDDQVAAAPGRGADPAGPSGLRARRWAGCCRREGFSLQATAKTLEGAQHPDRDAQFRYINEQVKAHQADGEPVISVDTKKKEQLGQLPMAGREWRPKGDPVEVEDHSFFSTGPDVELAIPYGDLRPHPRHRLGQRRRRPRHLRVRGRLDPPLVAGPRTPGLPEGDHGC